MKYQNIKKALEAWQNLQPLSEKDKERLSRRFTVDVLRLKVQRDYEYLSAQLKQAQQYLG